MRRKCWSATLRKRNFSGQGANLKECVEPDCREGRRRAGRTAAEFFLSGTYPEKVPIQANLLDWQSPFYHSVSRVYRRFDQDESIIDESPCGSNLP